MIKLALLMVLLIIIYDRVSSEVNLSAPSIQGIVVRDPLQFSISWDPIRSGDKDEPVLGYKVHVWETAFIPRVTYKDVDGEMIRVPTTPRRRKLGLRNLIKEHITNSTHIVQEADTTVYTRENIKTNITYEIKVQAFTKNTDGPLSTPNRLTLH